MEYRAKQAVLSPTDPSVTLVSSQQGSDIHSTTGVCGGWVSANTKAPDVTKFLSDSESMLNHIYKTEPTGLHLQKTAAVAGGQGTCGQHRKSTALVLGLCSHVAPESEWPQLQEASKVMSPTLPRPSTFLKQAQTFPRIRLLPFPESHFLRSSHTLNHLHAYLCLVLLEGHSSHMPGTSQGTLR